jgi:26S proteasome regulatory subunit N7
LLYREKNSAELAAIDEKLVEAQANAGDTEVLDCMIARAKCLSKTGQWEEALTALDAILNKEKTSTGKKIDAVMEKAKIALFNMVPSSALLDIICCGMQ